MYKFNFFFFFAAHRSRNSNNPHFFLHPNPKEIPCKNVPAPLCALSGGRDHSEPGWPSWMLAAKHKKIHFRNHFFPQKEQQKRTKELSALKEMLKTSTLDPKPPNPQIKTLYNCKYEFGSLNPSKDTTKHVFVPRWQHDLKGTPKLFNFQCSPTAKKSLQGVTKALQKPQSVAQSTFFSFCPAHFRTFSLAQITQAASSRLSLSLKYSLN